MSAISRPTLLILSMYTARVLSSIASLTESISLISTNLTVIPNVASRYLKRVYVSSDIVAAAMMFSPVIAMAAIAIQRAASPDLDRILA